MKNLRIMIFGLIIFACLANSSTTKIEGEIYIKLSTGESVKLSDVPILLISKSKAAHLRNNHLIDKFSLLNQELSSARTVAMSNNEGKFALNVPQGEYAIAVKATRIIDGESQVFFWLVDVNNQTRKTISLNNNNLTEDFVAEEQFEMQ